MTGTEILAQALLYAEDLEIDDAQGLALINECMIQDLGTDAGLTTSQTITAAADTWYTLDDTIQEIFEIDESGSNIPYFGSYYGEICKGQYDIRAGQIRFPFAGTYTIQGFILPPTITALAQTPDVNISLHYPICMYVAYRALEIEDEDDETAPKVKAKYEIKRDVAVDKLAALRPTTKRARIMKRRPYI